jgi:hypothetical protein
MSRFAFVVPLCAALSAVSSSLAQDIPLRFVTADGTWDCKDQTGATTGAVVVAETTYAFIKPDGKLGGYGKLFPMTEDVMLPTFGIVSGHMKDELGSLGLHMRGPREDPWNVSGDLYLNVVMTPDGKQDWDCLRR